MNRWLKWSALGAMVIAVGGGVGYYQYCCRTAIYDFVESRDKQFILDIFEKNWYWLVSEYSLDFSPEYMMHNRASSRDPQHVGNLTIKVLYAGTEPVGFTAYFKPKFYEGRVLFLAVREEFRSKGYGSQLLNYAIEALKKQGVNKIDLVTRSTNYAAQSVYKKAGFVQTSDDGSFVWFAYDPQIE
jgi:ribosomal protein S18 acetylase RimI-like enzyme